MEKDKNNWSMEDLDKIIQSRKTEMPAGSYVASLFRSGTERIAQKIGEEGVEVAIAATSFGITGRGKKELIGEVADLEFNIRVLLVQLGIPFSEVIETLRERNVEKTLKGGEKYEKNRNI